MLDIAHPAAAFGLGVALGTSPGPVQLLLFAEASRGGIGRGLRAMAGANGTFGAMLGLLATGFSSFQPAPGPLRAIQVVGGGFLLFVAVDAVRESRRAPQVEAPRSAGLHPALRGAIAVVLNPGVYVFLATTGAAVAADAAIDGGRGLAFVTVGALLGGVSLSDSAMVALGAGAHRVSRRALRLVSDVLAAALAALGVLLIVRGLA
ncbi:MAG TPA: LysE family transporter [Actinomycetota bacterium]|nr:LysE family transporter [Actinomycetota bacterium]